MNPNQLDIDWQNYVNNLKQTNPQMYGSVDPTDARYFTQKNDPMFYQKVYTGGINATQQNPGSLISGVSPVTNSSNLPTSPLNTAPYNFQSTSSLTAPTTTQNQTFQNTQTRQQQIDNSTAQGVIQPQMQALNNMPTSSNPATSPAIPNNPDPNVAPQMNALNASTPVAPTTNNGVGNSTSGNQMLPGQTAASFGNISQQMTPQDQQRQAIKTDPNNITGYQEGV